MRQTKPATVACVEAVPPVVVAPVGAGEDVREGERDGQWGGAWCVISVQFNPILYRQL